MADEWRARVLPCRRGEGAKSIAVCVIRDWAWLGRPWAERGETDEQDEEKRLVGARSGKHVRASRVSQTQAANRAIKGS